MKKHFSLETIKHYLSFTRMIRNDKLMMIASLIIAMITWFTVISGPANITPRSIKMDVTVDLTGSYAAQSGLRIVGNNEFTVEVNVKGPWATVVKLNESDFRVRADLSAITDDGVNDVPLIVSRNSSLSDYDLLSVTPDSVQITCEYWKEGTVFKIGTDTAGLEVADPESTKIGKAYLDKTAFSNGIVTIDGPEQTIDSIHRLVAKVESAQPLKETERFRVPLTAYNEDGAVVDISACDIREVPEHTVEVIVELWEIRTVNVDYNIVNLPSGIDDEAAFIEQYIDVDPQEMVLSGKSNTLDSMENKLNLGDIDFVTLLDSESSSMEFPVDMAEDLNVESGSEIVTVTLNAENMDSFTQVVTPTESSIRFVDESGADVTDQVNERYYVSLAQLQSSLNLSLFGDRDSVGSLTAENFVWTVTVDVENAARTASYAVTVDVQGYDDVWVVDENSTDNYTLTITLEDKFVSAMTSEEETPIQQL